MKMVFFILIQIKLIFQEGFSNKRRFEIENFWKSEIYGQLRPFISISISARAMPVWLCVYALEGAYGRNNPPPSKLCGPLKS